MRYELYYWPSIQGRGEFVRLALEDPATGPPFEDDRQAGLGRHRMVERPPLADPPSPRLEGVLNRAVDVKGQPDRLDHRAGRRLLPVLEATSRKRADASPHTRSM